MRIHRLIGLGMALVFSMPTVAQQAPSAGLSLVDAVRTTLATQPAIRAQQIRQAGQEGILQQARGGFDPRLSTQVQLSRARDPISAFQQAQFGGATEIVTDDTAYEMALHRRFRSGLTIRPGVEVRRSVLSVGGPGEAQSEFADNVAHVSVLFTQPLLKGRGATSVAAVERAASRHVQAEGDQLGHTTSASILNTVVAYWTYVAARQVLTILTASEARTRQLFEETETLVAADQRPAADLDQLRADVADKAGARIRAEQTLFAARQNLGRAVGLSSADGGRLPAPSDTLPSFALVGVPDMLAGRPFLDYALDHRQDLQAMRERTAAARLMRDAARRDQQHTLDLDLSLGYTGLDEGGAARQFFSPLGTNVGGLNISAGLRYEVPWNNREARGAFAVRQAAFAAQAIDQDDMGRHIEIDVEISVRNVLARRDGLLRAEEAVGHHRQALENEGKKFRQGFSTLFNVLLFQDRMTQAQLNHVVARSDLVVAVADLRHAIGMLAPSSSAALTLSELITMPMLHE